MFYPTALARRPYHRPLRASAPSAATTKLRTFNKTMDAVINTAEVGAAAFACGLVQGKWPGKNLWGVPYDLVAGLTLHVLGFAGVGGAKYARHMHSFGDGALASFLVTTGRDVGARLDTLMSGVSGMDGVSGGASLADEELARMVRAGR